MFTLAEDAATAAAQQSKRLKGRAYREAAERKEAEAKAKPTEKQPVTGRSGRIMEVVIKVSPGHRSAQNGSRISAKDATSSGSDSDAPRKLKPRAAKRRVLVISDEEEASASDFEAEHSDEKLKPKKKNSKTSSSRKKAAKSKASRSSDYEDSSAEETPSETEMSAHSSDEASAKSSKKTRIIKALPKRTKSASASSQVSTTDDDRDIMEVDDPASTRKKKSTKGKTNSQINISNDEDTDVDAMEVDGPAIKGKKTVTKRKAADNATRPAKKQKRTESDPWKLESKPVKKDWTQMKAPPLEMFHFMRKVVDEYTYLDGKIHSLATNLTAERHWVLSGTPPIHDFGALKTIAAFLNLHLGVDDDAEGSSAEVKKRRREQTGI